MSILGSNMLAGAAGRARHEIERSLRFNSGDSAYLNRTPGSAGNRRTFTFSCWCKRSKLGINATLFSAATNTDNFFKFSFKDDNRFEINTYENGDSTQMFTTAVFRDVSSWYHIVVAFDTTQSTAANRVKLYVNGTQVTAFDNNTLPSQNHETVANSTGEHQVGNQINNTRYFDGYIAEVNQVDGLQLGPESFGQTELETGAWIPRQYNGSYGTNGFYLKFADNSGVTATTLGKDSSGNGNNWTPNNFQVSTPGGTDSMEDTPTNNWCTLNQLNTDNVSTFSNGNLETVCNNASTSGGSIAVNSGKWYAEVVCTAKTAVNAMVGICTIDGFDGERQLDESQNGGSGHGYVMNGTKLSGGASYGATWAIDDVIGIALDLDSAQNTVTFYKNGTSQGAINIDNTRYVFACSNGQASSTVTYAYNFGQRAFAYTPPAGFQALNSKNLPTPTIKDGTKYFNTVLFTGNGSTQSITGVGFQPDWTWIKMRSDGSRGHALFDSVRGGTERLDSSATQEGRTNEGNISFQADGFNVTSSHPTVNDSSDTAVAWNWKAGGTASYNGDGSFTSLVSANPEAGFSIVSFDAPSGSNQETIGHGLNVKPKVIISKNRDTNANNWAVFHEDITDTTSKFLRLNTTDSTVTYSTVWGSALPTSTVFGVTGGGIAASGTANIAYCFAEVEGYSKFGTFIGNGSSGANGNGPYVYCGFRPAFMIIKVNNSAYNWYVYDSKRNTYNAGTYLVFPNLDDSESQSTDHFDWLSNGFKVKGDTLSPSGTTVFFMAFAERPFKYANAV